MLASISCGGGGLDGGPVANSYTSPTSASGVSVTIVPATLTLAPGAAYQFRGTVNGSKDPTVIWSSNGGNISQSGYFIAPPVAPKSGILNVTATAEADGSVVAISYVTVTTPS